MASTYSTNLALELIATGEQAGSWGITTNNNFGTLLEQAISGYVTQVITDGADTVITIPNGATGTARNMTIELTGALTAARNLIVPSNRKLYFIYNNTTGGYAVTVKVSGQTGVSVPNGTKLLLVSNGTDVVNATSYLTSVTPGGSNTQIQYNNNGVLGGSTLTYNNSTGGFAIAAPSSGTALSVNGLAGQRIASFQGASGSDAYISINAFGSASQWWINNKTGSGNLDFYEATLGATRMTIGYAGNVIINTPVSGTTLSAYSVAGGAAAAFYAPASSTCSVYLYGNNSNGNLILQAGNDNNGYISASNSLFVNTGGSQRITVGNNGNVTINAPASGAGLTVSGAASANAIAAISGSSGTALSMFDSTQTYYGSFQVGSTAITANASNSWQFNTAGNARVLLSSTGNVTINAPSSGTALSVAGSSVITSTQIASFTHAGNGTSMSINSSAIAGGYIAGSAAGDSAIRAEAYNLNLGSVGGAVNIGTATTQIAKFTNTGTVFYTPTSGTTVTANGASGQSVFSANVSGNGISLYTTNGTATGVAGYYSGNTTFFGSTSAHAMGLLTSNTARMTISDVGNVTINAPTSGAALTVKATGSGIATIAATATAAQDSYADFAGNGNTTLSTSFTVGQAADNNAYLYQRANASIILGTNSANRVLIGSAGNVTINAPTSGTALTVNGNIQLGAASPVVEWNNGGPRIYSSVANTLQFATDSVPTERMRLDSSGNLGLGVTPSAWGGGGKNIQLAAGGSITSNGATGYFSNTYFDGANYRYITSLAAGGYVQNTNQHLWYTAPSGTAGNAISFTQAMTLDASGQLIVGGTTAQGTAASRGNITINGASQSILSLSIGNSLAGYVLHSGSDLWLNNALVGSMLFYNNGSERARIDTSGNLGLGVTPSSWQTGRTVIELGGSVQSTIALNGNNANGGAIWTNAYYGSGGSGTANYYKNNGYATIFGTSNGGFQFLTAPSGTAGTVATFTQAMTLDASGNLLVGATSFATRNENSIMFQPSGGYTQSAHASGTASGAFYSAFMYNAVAIGSITQSGTTAVLYNTTSDARLKTNVQDAPDASALIDSIKVRSFDWISDESHQRYGMVAQELYEVAPEAVHAPADPDEMMAVDYSKLVPMLIKEVQSLRARVAQLEAK